MYRVELCDDKEAEIDKVERILKVYEGQREEHLLSIARFQNAEELLQVMKSEKYEPDLLLMDICMPGKSGIEAVCELRGMEKKSSIIFLTVSREYALDAFRVDAVQYLLKPVTEEELFPVLDKVFGNLEKMRKKYLLLDANGRVYRIALCDIVYCEAQRKSQCIYLADGTSLMLRMTMTKIYELLSEYQEFVKVGIAYIVNLEHIDSMNTQELKMDSGEIIYLPRGAYKVLREQYFEYYCSL